MIAAGQHYLRIKRGNRIPVTDTDTIRPEVYPDESYVGKKHSNDFIRYSGEDGPRVRKPAGKGERLIIVNAIIKSGRVPDLYSRVGNGTFNTDKIMLYHCRFFCI